MNIEYYHEYSELADRATSVILEELERKSNLMLCAATGKSPTGVYANLAEKHKRNPGIFSGLKVVKLDEWWGIPHGSPVSCDNYLKNALIDPLQIPDKQFISFLPDTVDPEMECFRIQSLLIRKGPIDVAILGMGKNGHLGFNEPGATLEPDCHLSQLSEMSRSHDMLDGLDPRPAYGMTLGIKDILSAKRILLLVAGEGKEKATRELLSGAITTRCPATFLRLHHRVNCLIMKSSQVR